MAKRGRFMISRELEHGAPAAAQRVFDCCRCVVLVSDDLSLMARTFVAECDMFDDIDDSIEVPPMYSFTAMRGSDGVPVIDGVQRWPG